MPELLVSVRSAAEAEAALAGGAGLLDVKEPARGPLGRADDDTIRAVLAAVAGRRPVSAALGELIERAADYPGPGLAFVKRGLGGCGGRADWGRELLQAIAAGGHGDPSRGVGVAYADWQSVQAPPPAEVCAFACTRRLGAFLLDTARKDGRTLLDWLTPEEIGQLCRACRRTGVRVALAGSLGTEQIDRLRPAEPDWFAVRGAVCHAGRRESAIDPERVRHLVDLLGGQRRALPKGGSR